MDTNPPCRRCAAHTAAALAAAMLMASCGSPPRLAITDPSDHISDVVKASRPKVVAAKNTEATGEQTLPTARIAQETPNWCWAACAQMVLAARGIHLEQADIAARVHGIEGVRESRAAEYREMLIALCPDLPDHVSVALRRAPELLGQRELQIDPWGAMLSQVEHQMINSDDLVNALSSGPAIVVLSEGDDVDWTHAYVVSGIGYVESRLSAAKRVLEPVLEVDLPPRVNFLGDTPADVIGHGAEWIPDFAVVWVDLIDPDMNALETPPADASDAEFVPARPRISGQEFADRVRLILTPEKAREILMKQYDVVRGAEFRIGGKP